MHKRGLVIMCLAAITVTAAADTNLVITATRSPREAVRTPASVTVLDKDTIDLSAAWNLDDLLRSLDGVFVLRSVGFGTGLPSQINMRGIPGQHATLLLVDGMPLNDAASGFMNINEVPLSAASRIEVVRGPFSALYGTDAFGGVVHILTGAPHDQPALETRARVGNHGFQEITVQGSHGTPRWGVSATVAQRQTDNYLNRGHVTIPLWTGSTFLETRRDAENYDYQDDRVLLKLLGRPTDDLEVEILGRFFDSELGYGQTILPSLYPTPVDSIIEQQTVLAGTHLRWRASEDVSYRLSGYYREQDQTALGLNLSHLSAGSPVYVPSEQENTAADWKLEGAVVAQASASHRLTAGADMLANRVEFSPQEHQLTGQALPLSSGADEDILNAGLYVQDEWRCSERVEWIAGLRLDSHSEFGEAWSPKLGVVWEASADTVIRGSVGRAYRAPTLLELYQPAAVFGSVTFMSNPDLDPEYMISADSEIRHQLSDSVTCHAGLFYNDMTDLITKRVMGTMLVYDNTGEAWSAGLEAGVSWECAAGITLFANLTRQETEDRDLDENLEHMANEMLNAGIRAQHRIGRWTSALSVTENYIGERGYYDLSSGLWSDLDAYWRTDLVTRITYRERIWLGLAVENLTDEAYQEWPLVAKAPSRSYAVEAGVRW